MENTKYSRELTEGQTKYLASATDAEKDWFEQTGFLPESIDLAELLEGLEKLKIERDRFGYLRAFDKRALLSMSYYLRCSTYGDEQLNYWNKQRLIGHLECFLLNAETVFFLEEHGAKEAFEKPNAEITKISKNIRLDILQTLAARTVTPEVADKIELPPERQEAIILILKKKFKNLEKLRPSIKWEEVEKSLRADPKLFFPLHCMLVTGGSPEVVADENGNFVFAECGESSDLRMRGDFAWAEETIKSWGVELMDIATFVALQLSGPAWLKRESNEQMQKLLANSVERLPRWSVKENEPVRYLIDQSEVVESKISVAPIGSFLSEAYDSPLAYKYGTERFSAKTQCTCDPQAQGILIQIAPVNYIASFRCVLRVPKAQNV